MLQPMATPEDPIIAHRRARLRAWIDEHFWGSHTLFIASTNDGVKQINQGELSGLLRSKSFGEKRARSLEAMAHMPPRYLDDMGDATPPPYEHQTREATPPPISAADKPRRAAPPPPVGWPFHKVSLARIVALKKALGAKAGAAAMEDLNDTLEVAVTKWERRVESRAKSAA